MNKSYLIHYQYEAFKVICWLKGETPNERINRMIDQDIKDYPDYLADYNKTIQEKKDAEIIEQARKEDERMAKFKDDAKQYFIRKYGKVPDELKDKV